MSMHQLSSFHAHLSGRLPISVITGFLGSGKTTVLNRLLRHPRLQRTAVIVNEWGTIGIDHLLVRSAREDVILMEGGCLCCTVRGDLVQTLQELFNKRVRMEVPEFDRVVIETSGLADPAPIIHTLLADSVVTAYYRLEGVLTTVDSIYGLSQLDEHYETVKQAALADRLLLTKTDLVDAQTVSKLRERLQRLNPAAACFEVAQLDTQMAQLFNTGLYNPATKAIDVQQWLQSEVYHQQGSLHHHSDTEISCELHHDSYIKSFCLEYEQPLSWKVLNRWFQQLTALRGKDLLRVKGIVHTVESDLPIIVQGVQHIFQPPTTLSQWPTSERRSQIVFITRNIDKTVIERMLEVLIHSRTVVESCAAALILLGNV